MTIVLSDCAPVNVEKAQTTSLSLTHNDVSNVGALLALLHVSFQKALAILDLTHLKGQIIVSGVKLILEITYLDWVCKIDPSSFETFDAMLSQEGNSKMSGGKISPCPSSATRADSQRNCASNRCQRRGERRRLNSN